jgi:hypothetical protein
MTFYNYIHIFIFLAKIPYEIFAHNSRPIQEVISYEFMLTIVNGWKLTNN